MRKLRINEWSALFMLETLWMVTMFTNDSSSNKIGYDLRSSWLTLKIITPMYDSQLISFDEIMMKNFLNKTESIYAKQSKL
jgi:hypothetical protein